MKKKFESLDSLRTILALSVALGHYFYWNGVGTPFPRSFFLAVDFFFVLSGFVLAQSAFASRMTSVRAYFTDFVRRRFFRLYPLYFVLFLCCVFILFFQHGVRGDPARLYLSSFLLMQGVGWDAGARFIFADTTIGIAWSISVEIWIGIVFFPFVFGLRKKHRSLITFSILVAGMGLLLMIQYSPNFMDVNMQKLIFFVTFGSIRGFIGFALGVLSFLVYRRLESRRFWNSPLKVTVVEVALILFLIFLFGINGYRQKDEFLAPFLFAVLIPVLALEVGLLAKILLFDGWAPLRPLSYSIYLSHPFFIFIWRQLNIPFNHKFAVLYTFLVLGAASALYAKIEKPWIAKGRRGAVR